MPLEVLVPLVIFGIVFAVVLVKYTVNAPQRLLTGSAMVQAVFALDYPTAVIAGKIQISSNQQVAIFSVTEPADHLGLVEVMGSKHLTRLLAPDDIRHIDHQNPNEYSIDLRDFTLPNIKVKFATRNEANAFKTEIDRLVHLQTEHVS